MFRAGLLRRDACIPGRGAGVRLWLVRHPQPLIAEGICYGQLDVAADPAAVVAATTALEKALPRDLPLFSSPLARAASLAYSLALRRPDLTLQFDDALKEVDFGRWEGKAWDDIPKEAVDVWVKDFADHQFGGGESASQLVQRVQSRLRALTHPVEVVWLTHAGVIKAVHFLNETAHQQPRILSARDWPQQRIAFGSYEVIDIDCC